jgi:hypothetical protein
MILSLWFSLLLDLNKAKPVVHIGTVIARCLAAAPNNFPLSKDTIIVG